MGGEGWPDPSGVERVGALRVTGMKRCTVYISVLAALVALWVGLVVYVQQTGYEKWSKIVYALPLYGLVCLGSFCIGKLGIDLLTFHDYPHEIGALEKNIEAAKADLVKRGF